MFVLFIVHLYSVLLWNWILLLVRKGLTLNWYFSGFRSERETEVKESIVRGNLVVLSLTRRRRRDIDGIIK